MGSHTVADIPGRRTRAALGSSIRTGIVRDPASNARWTVDAVLAERGLKAASPAVEAPTPAAAKREARARNAPLLLSRQVLRGTDFVPVAIDGLELPRRFHLVLPAVGEPAGRSREVVDRIREAARIWLR